MRWLRYESWYLLFRYWAAHRNDQNRIIISTELKQQSHTIIYLLMSMRSRLRLCRWMSQQRSKKKFVKRNIRNYCETISKIAMWARPRASKIPFRALLKISLSRFNSHVKALKNMQIDFDLDKFKILEFKAFSLKAFCCRNLAKNPLMASWEIFVIK